MASSSYRDSLNPTALSNDFNFGHFDNTKNTTSYHPAGLQIDEDSFLSTDWEEKRAENENPYMKPLNWESPESKFNCHPPVNPPVNPSVINPFDATQKGRLKKNVMRRDNQYYSHRSSQSTSSFKSHSVSSPDTNDRNRKRKSIPELEDEEDEDSNPLVKKTAHNMIEKRYRTNLNDKIAALRDSVPSLRIMSKSARGEDTMDDREELQGLKPAHKLNKATVLSKATEYICHLEKRNKYLQQENSDHKARLAAYETLFRSSPIEFNGTQGVCNPFQSSFDYSSSGTPQPDLSHQVTVQEPNDSQRLNTQNNQTNYHNIQQETYPQYQQQPLWPDGWNGHSYMGKLMIGTMAGLMIVEGFSEAEQNPNSPVGRGLFALPTGLLRSIRYLFRFPRDINVFGCHASWHEVFWYLKFVLIISSVLYIILPDLFSCRFNTNRSKAKNALLSAAPSLASPIQVRRQAWLTAIQTVWVPRHNLFLEAAALSLKIAKLSSRNLFGSQTYTYMTGITENQEAARIKAWSIALDAQLAGGDVEVNKSRLTLTLLASTTLPDTPSRQMLKALHIRLLLWDLGNASLYGFYLFRGLASKIVRSSWKKALLLQEISTHQKDDIDSLPGYLNALLQQDCDEVLNDSIAQRAYNLAWNLPTTNNILTENSYMDSVVDDFAIRSPLDAVAAWFSSFVLHRAIFKSLQIKEESSNDQKVVADEVELAIRTAPIGSEVQIRALVTRSILVKDKRETSIAEAMKALGPMDKQLFQDTPLNLVNIGTSINGLPEVKLSLRCAMIIAHIERSSSQTIPEKIVQLIESTSPRNLSLLGFVAKFKLMDLMNKHEKISKSCINSLEKLSGGLRIWIGGKDGDKIGLPIKIKKEKIEYCLEISRRIVGMQDAGYASMNEESEMSEKQ